MKYQLSLVALTVFLSACTPASSDLMPGSTSGNKPKQIFEGVIFEPMPSDVSNLQVGAHTWQGYNVAMRFTASSETRAKILQQGYESVPCKRGDLANKDFTFTPYWDPPMEECYEWNGVLNAWTGAGMHHISVNPETQEIYLVGVSED